MNQQEKSINHSTKTTTTKELFLETKQKTKKTTKNMFIFGFKSKKIIN